MGTYMTSMYRIHVLCCPPNIGWSLQPEFWKSESNIYTQSPILPVSLNVEPLGCLSVMSAIPDILKTWRSLCSIAHWRLQGMQIGTIKLEQLREIYFQNCVHIVQIKAHLQEISFGLRIQVVVREISSLVTKPSIKGISLVCPECICS